ncbi:uncharacterized protein LOC114789356 isoform X2 [Denticeps clupeoides]|uniref:uncharacterized protein LOC114789356 isoform X2 n=1 Tax=Denticeps clupeoides TaxID=299321 RepID=UPI0010A32EE0|nr:uncharacterized protein LOC114789356 isoform X2 [Denticeps clupeoides]
MERQITQAILLCWFVSVLKRTSGEEVELRVRPGDNITLNCDCTYKSGHTITWFRNCSHEHQPPLILTPQEMWNRVLPRYSLIWNPTNNSNDLFIQNMSESDIGLYYCALELKKVTDDKQIAQRTDIHFGRKTTRVLLEDCVQCWILLVSLCPVSSLICSLISSACVYCFCLKKGSVESETGQNRASFRGVRRREQIGEENLCYASLDIQSKGHRVQRPSKQRSQKSDFSTYAEVKIKHLESHLMEGLHCREPAFFMEIKHNRMQRIFNLINDFI